MQSREVKMHENDYLADYDSSKDGIKCVCILAGPVIFILGTLVFMICVR
jgi:hypothetical protein